MDVRFKEKYLEELYKNGSTSDKNHRFQPEVIRKYRKRVNTLWEKPHIKSLLKHRSLHFEALTGDKKGQYSIRVDDQYRISFTVTKINTKPVTTICEILKLSNHYD
jgi:proteic killer suppression protein